MPKITKAAIIVVEIFSTIGLIGVNLLIDFKSTTPEIASAGTIAPTSEPTIAQRIETMAETEVATTSAIPKKESYIIAFFGDSMIETMGGGLPYVYKELRKKYPKTGFVLYNYGIGSENVVEAISRFGLPYGYKDRSFPPLPELGADIIVLGSYAYNPLTPFDKNESWLLLAELINKTKATGAEIYLLAEQAPIKEGFGTGVGGVNWPAEISDPHVDKIVQGLKNAVGLSETLGIGLINVFKESRAEGSEYGNPDYVAVHDGIHYSEEGQEFSAIIIAESIELK